MDWTALDGFSIAVVDLGNNSVAGRTPFHTNKRSDKTLPGVLEKLPTIPMPIKKMEILKVVSCVSTFGAIKGDCFLFLCFTIHHQGNIS